MSKPKLSVRSQAILLHVWNLNYQEKQLMDQFFLLHDTWGHVSKDIIVSEEQACMLLRQNMEDFKVILLDSLPRVRAATDLGLSFRANFASGMRVVLIKEWAENSKEPPQPFREERETSDL